MDAPWLAGLNEQQRAAATAGDGPLLIIAGAGTGKTNTLARRVAHLIGTGTSPGRILLLTFTRRAAAEMTKRAEDLLAANRRGGGLGGRGSGGASPTLRLWAGTFHAIANRLLRIHAKALGLGESFVVTDRSDAEDLLNTVRSELGLDKGDVRFPRKATCMSIYSRCVNAQEPVEDALRGHFPWCAASADQLKQLFRAYTGRKHEQNTLDYDDLLLYWFHIMQDESVAAEVRKRFDAVLVDEYQDTNLLQANVLQKLCPEGKGLTVVGDDAQSIYAFRAATVHNILDFPRVYPGTTIVKLEQNYRSVQSILDCTNAVIALSPQRYNKDLFSKRGSEQKPRLVTLMDEEQQCEYVIKQVLEHHEAGIPLRKQAVLFRAAHHSDALEIELARRNIPFVKYGGLKFLEAAHVKDALCILRMAENPRDATSAFRVLQLLDGIGPAAARKAIAHLAENRFDLRSWKDFRPPAAAVEQWGKLVELLVRLAGGEGGDRAETSFSTPTLTLPRSTGGGDERSTGAKAAIPLPEQIAAVRLFYTPILERRYDQAHIRGRDLEQLEQIASNSTSRSAMLSELALDPPASTQDLAGPPLMDEDYLILSTIHSAKGCEWDAVYVIHAADGNIPSDMATGSDDEIEEERRLFYVAMTRARDFLEICFPLKYYHRRRSDQHTYAQLTRFLPESLLHHFERVSMQTQEQPDAMATAAASANIRKKIAAMWE
jgi:DNA helicase-2/ATP-dependent DNA helicase PcrA